MVMAQHVRRADIIAQFGAMKDSVDVISFFVILLCMHVLQRLINSNL